LVIILAVKNIVPVHGFSVLPATKTADKGSKVQ